MNSPAKGEGAGGVSSYADQHPARVALERFLDSLCASCRAKAEKASRELTYTSRFVGTNQFSLKRRWKGHDVTPLEQAILKTLQHRRGGLRQDELQKKVGAETPHSVRTAIYNLRRKLKGWTIVSTPDGYKLHEVTQEDGSSHEPAPVTGLG